MRSQKSLLILLGLVLTAPLMFAQDSTEERQRKALEVLRRTIDEQQKGGKVVPPSRTAPPSHREPTFAEIERQYLEGKISAKQFQKYLQDHKIERVPVSLPTNSAAQTRGPEVVRKEAPKTTLNPPQTAAIAPPATVSPKTNTLPPPVAAEVKLEKPDATPEPSALAEVEKKMDELLRLKAARDQATNAVSNAAPNSASPPAPKTKRQRLDELLKSYIDGKIPEAEYREKRAKLIAEPN